MLDAVIRLATSVALAGAGGAADAGRAVLGDDLLDIRPRQFRRLLLTFEESIQGRIPEILGDSDEERVETLVRLLRGTSERDLAVLVGDLQAALGLLREEGPVVEARHQWRHRDPRGEPDRRRARRPT